MTIDICDHVLSCMFYIFNRVDPPTQITTVWTDKIMFKAYLSTLNESICYRSSYNEESQYRHVLATSTRTQEHGYCGGLG